jgi:aminoglycoside 6-adenylyltransferase
MMRNEKEMLDVILGFARGDDRIRAVMMNGSRANPNAPRDIFQDYDIVYFVPDVNAFVRDRSWIGRFGELMIMQTPGDQALFPNDQDYTGYSYLMQFTDGNRIDLTFYPVDKIDDRGEDSLTVLLLDKDGRFGQVPPSSDAGYLTKPPSAGQFSGCCNEFWWVSTNIAKGLWRKELSYAKFMFDGPVRDMLIQMLQWQIGVKTDFKADSGKYGKYMEKYLAPQRWNEFVQTYPDGDYDNIWNSLFIMGDLFRKTAVEISEHYGFVYPHDDDARVTAHLKHVRDLLKDAKVVYE